MDIRPIRCLRPTAGKAASFAAPPYDVFNRASARAYVRSHPRSFLGIDRPETQFPPEQGMYAPVVYERARQLIEGYVADGTLVEDGPAYYLWSMERDGRCQTGVVCACSIAEYEDGTIARHERTFPEKERDRIEHIRATGYQTGPIFLAHRPSGRLSEARKPICAGEPLYSFADDQGTLHRVWKVGEPDAVELQAALAELPRAYIADGHHRTASAAKVGAADGAFLAVLFPSDELTILPYDRVLAEVADAHGLAGLLREAGLEVEEVDAAFEPALHEFAICCDGSWLSARVPDALVGEGPVSSLDCSLLQELVLEPVFGVADPATDERMSFVGGMRHARDLGVRSTGCIGFALHATSMDELMAVADAGMLMPQKSTWFEPKLLSGLFLRPIA